MIKICFIGLGSIGKRHLINICKVLNDRGIDYSIDAIRHTNKELPDNITNLISNQYKSLKDTDQYYDIIFVTDPTINHFETIKESSGHCDNMFIEKPVFANFKDDLSELNLKENGTYYVACPMRYDPIMIKIKELIADKKVLSVRCISSSYLPDWRNGIDYRTNYSAIKEMGGGVTLDLIHEVDYITWLFGQPDRCVNVNGKYSNLEITSDDLSVYILKYHDKVVEIHLDYFGRETVRNIEIYCDECKIIGDFIDRQIIFADEYGIRSNISFDEYEDYIREMEIFLDMVQGDIICDNNVCHANEILRLIEESKI